VTNHQQVEASSGAGMTLVELREFLARAEAAGIPGSTRVRTKVRFNRMITEISVHTRDNQHLAEAGNGE
jgi:hypothetical protein